MEQSFERAARGEAEPAKIDCITVEDAVNRFLATKQTEGVGSRYMPGMLTQKGPGAGCPAPSGG